MPQIDYLSIPLTQGQIAKVSPCDFDRISAFKWCAWWHKDTRSYYARRACVLPEGKTVTVYMHREVLGLAHGDPRTGDHRNHDTLNNGRENLRIASDAENTRNQRVKRANTTGFKGVTPFKSIFSARIRIGGKRVTLGYRRTPEEAHALYSEAARRAFGEFAQFDPAPFMAITLRTDQRAPVLRA